MMSPKAKADAPKPEPPAVASRKPSQADEAHIATAEYGRKQKAAMDRIGALKAQRLAHEAREPAKPKRKTKAVTPVRPKTTAYRRWGV